MAKDDAADVMETCRRNARTMLASNPDAALESIEELAACVETGVARKLEIANEEISFQARIRTGMAGLLENYTCVDGNLTSTPDVSSADWNFKGINRRVHVKHDRPASQIHVIEDFISPEECLAMEQEAARTLHHATVADGKGGSRLSDNRKAMQAGITVEWETEAEGNLIAQLSRRVYDYTENVLKLGIQEHGQEDLMSIQYFGRGRNDTEPDRYTPVSVVLWHAKCIARVSSFPSHRFLFFFFTALRRRLHRPSSQDRYSHGHHAHVLQLAHRGRFHQLSQFRGPRQTSCRRCRLFFVHESRNKENGCWVYGTFGMSSL